MANEKLKAVAGHLPNWEFWHRQLVYRATNHRTTWKLRLLMAVLLLGLLITTSGWWIPALGWSLVCSSVIEKPDLILIDNLDSDYLLFEKAADMKRRGTCNRVLIPVMAAGQDTEKPCLVALGIADLMIRLTRLEGVEIFPITEAEPITLNMARQVGDYLKGGDVRTVLILTPGFKSRRIHLIFSKVLGKAGIETYCLPVWGSHRPANWASSCHGIQEVFLQYAKLAYYRLWVL